MLLEGYTEAMLAAGKAADALQKVEFNARDYYVQHPDAWTLAQQQRRQLFQKLADVKAELVAHMDHIMDEHKKRNQPRG